MAGSQPPSASGSPSPAQMAKQFPITPQEASAIADAMGPIRHLLQAGSGIGSTMENLPGAGPQLAGALLQNASDQAELAATTVKTLSRAVEFYGQVQAGGLQQVFPPPHVVLSQAEKDIKPLFDLLDQITGAGGGGGKNG